MVAVISGDITATITVASPIRPTAWPIVSLASGRIRKITR